MERRSPESETHLPEEQGVPIPAETNFGAVDPKSKPTADQFVLEPEEPGKPVEKVRVPYAKRQTIEE